MKQQVRLRFPEELRRVQDVGVEVDCVALEEDPPGEFCHLVRLNGRLAFGLLPQSFSPGVKAAGFRSRKAQENVGTYLFGVCKLLAQCCIYECCTAPVTIILRRIVPIPRLWKVTPDIPFFRSV